MTTIRVTKGFKFQQVTVASMLETRLFGAPDYTSVVKRYRKGALVQFENSQEADEFMATAQKYGGSAERLA